MDAFDEVMFTYALLDEFADLVIKKDIGKSGEVIERRSIKTIAECEQSYIAELYIPISESDDWLENAAKQPEFRRPRRQYIHFCRSRWIYSGRGSERWAFKPPTLIEGSVGASYRRDDRAAKRVVDKVWRILEKITTNLPRYEFDERGRRRKQRSMGPDVWYGHHALEWCRSDPKFMLNGNARPTPDWELPNTEWFRGLYERVVAAYGPDFGKPEPPEPGPSPSIGFRLG